MTGHNRIRTTRGYIRSWLTLIVFTIACFAIVWEACGLFGMKP